MTHSPRAVVHTMDPMHMAHTTKYIMAITHASSCITKHPIHSPCEELVATGVGAGVAWGMPQLLACYFLLVTAASRVTPSFRRFLLSSARFLLSSASINKLLTMAYSPECNGTKVLSASTLVARQQVQKLMA